MWVLCGSLPYASNKGGRRVKKIALLICLISFVFAATAIEPVKRAKVDAAILDMAIADGKVYLATDASEVVIADTNLTILNRIKVRKIKDFMGTLNNADIYSVDVLGKKVLYLAQAEGGYAELFVYENGKSTKVLDKSLMLYAKAAKFVDSKRAIIALMSDEVILYDIAGKKILKRVKAGEYFYSCMAIEKGRKYVAIGDEGGEVIVVDTQTLQRVKLFKDVNKDKILSIYINRNLIAAGSRADKTLALYSLDGSRPKVYKNPDFFIYVVGLSPDNHYVVFGDNEKYILKVADTNSLDIRYKLIGHKNLVNVVRFLDANSLLTGSETGELIKWRLK